MESYDTLFKLAENAAPPENRVMPPDRIYIKTGKTVSMEEALGMMKRRKSDPTQIIKGGLDDESDEVRKSSLGKKEERIQGAFDPDAEFNEEPSNGETQKPRRGRKTPDREKSLSGQKLDWLVSAVKSMLKASAEPEKPSEAKPSPLDDFKSESHYVTYAINGMRFTCRCHQKIMDEVSHCLVLAFPDSGDSFFTPPVQSTLSLEYDGKPVQGTMFYFGMDFTLHQLGLRFLGFICDPGEGKGAEDEEEA